MQKIRDGEPLGGKPRPEDDFATDFDDDRISFPNNLRWLVWRSSSSLPCIYNGKENSMKTLSIDIETFSSADLKRPVSINTPPHQTLKSFIWLQCGRRRNSVVDLASGEQLTEEIINALNDPNITKWAFNSRFERICLSRWLGLPTGNYLDPKSWRCTMIWSAYMGLPLSLEGVGAVLGLEKKAYKRKRPNPLFCTPCKPTITNGGRMRTYQPMIQINGNSSKPTIFEMWRLKWPYKKD